MALSINAKSCEGVSRGYEEYGSGAHNNDCLITDVVVEPLESHFERKLIDLCDVRDCLFDGYYSARVSLRGEFGQDLNSWDSACEDICSEIVSYLRESFEDNLDIEIVRYEGDDDYHVFLVMQYEDTTFLIDPTYKQYLDINDRFSTDDVLMIPIFSEEELRNELDRVLLPSENHEKWIDPLYENGYL